MTHDSSASTREQAPHVNQTTRTATIINALKRRANSTVEPDQVDSESETKDDERGRENDEPSREKIEALAELICNTGEEASGALFVLMGTLQNSSDPKALANAVKHFTFTRCGELNIFGIVDAQIAVIEGELMARNSMTS